MRSKYPGVSIIGAGNVGSAVGHALAEKGYTILSIISRSGRSALALAKDLKCKKASTVIEDIPPATELLIIAVPDGAITEVGKRLSASRVLKFPKVFAAHTSGVLTASVLEPIRKKGAIVASMHPIQSFPYNARAKRISRLNGIYFGIEGKPEAIAKARELVNNLGGKTVIVPSELKPLYHVTCVFASGYMVVLMNAISELAHQLKLNAYWPEVFGPLMTTAMENTIKESAHEALTGPILRGDMATVEAHLLALANRAPQFLPLYTVGGIEVARIAKERGRVSQQEMDCIIKRFKKFIGTTPLRITTKVKH